MSYSRTTYNSHNPLARFAHRQRFKNSILSIHVTDGITVLDYGCGDGKFLNELAEKYKANNIQLIGFEPYMPAIANNKIKIVQHLEELGGNKFDYVTCFEVMEHFNPQKQEAICVDFTRLLKPEGTLIVSVPIEIGFPALIKNIRRKYSYKGNQFTFKNIFRSILGKPMPEYRNREGYLDHMGFSYKDLELLFKKYFTIKNKTFSPLKGMGPNVNSQVFYELSLKRS